MKITIFTSNHKRHNHYINLLIKRGHEVMTVIEATTLLSGIIEDHFKSSHIFETYFRNVLISEEKIFREDKFIIKPEKIIILKCGDLSFLRKNDLSGFLNSDCYLTFGCSYIKGWLADFLVKNNCLNIHMGISPYYRGSNCNFWAAYDNNYEYVGGTLHFLSKGLDNGPIISLVFPDLDYCENPFDFSMKSVKTSQMKMVDIIENNDISSLKSYTQDNDLLKRYTKNSEFNECVAKEFLERRDTIPKIEKCLKRVGSDKNHPLYELYKLS